MIQASKQVKKVGLVLEGGSMRGLYTAGVLDVFMEENIHVDGIIGVSAGALFGPNYFSKQKGRVLRYNKRFCKDLRYMSFPSFLLTGNLVNRKFAYYDVTSKYDIFDNETFIRNNTGYFVTATNVETGEAEYLEMKDIVGEMEILRATSAIPFLSQIVEINDKKYLDGGVADSIPVLQCQKMGYDKIIVVLTRPIEYKKQPMSEKLMKLMKLKYKKYSRFIEAMKNRHINYNDTIETIKELETKNQIFVIRPSQPIQLKTIVRDPEQLQKVYDLGVKDCKNNLNDLNNYLNIE